MTRISFHGACHSGAGRSGPELRFCRGMMYVEPRGALPTTGAACPATASRLCFAGWLSASAVLPPGAASPAFSRSALRSCSSRRERRRERERETGRQGSTRRRRRALVRDIPTASSFGGTLGRGDASLTSRRWSPREVHLIESAPAAQRRRSDRGRRCRLAGGGGRQRRFPRRPAPALPARFGRHRSRARARRCATSTLAAATTTASRASVRTRARRRCAAVPMRRRAAACGQLGLARARSRPTADPA